jgi:GT2 family glycosyltransferase
MMSNPPTLQDGLGISIVLYRPDLFKLSRTILHLKEALLEVDRVYRNFESTLFLIDNSVPPLDYHTLNRFVQGHYFSYEHPAHRVVIKRLGKNVGYGAGHNVAILSHGFKYHLILNPDVYIFRDTLVVFKRYAEEQKDAVLLGPMILSPDGTLQYLLRRDPTLLDVVLRFIAIFFEPVSRLKRYRRYECRDVDMYSSQVGYLMSGCCMWCRTDALREIGGFDERFFLYCEDHDLSVRLRSVGKVVYLPAARVIHDWERVMVRSPGLILTNIRSTVLFFYKWRWKVF